MGLVVGRRAPHDDVGHLGRALGVGRHLAGQLPAGLGAARRRARRRLGDAALAPLASTSTVSLVDVQPSTVTG